MRRNPTESLRPSSPRGSARRSLRRPLTILSGVALAILLQGVDNTATAAWPPPESATKADMKDPANWPNDPGYGYVAAQKPADRKKGLWQYYSFIPDRSPGAPAIREEETASGMSVDLAWRYTIGRDDVLIAVLDSGIKWDERDLVEKAYLNLGELATHKPLDAQGQACGGTGAIAGFDCNGDGIVTVADYADDPALTPEATDGRPKGDANLNGVLDAGDLILNYSDGIDDDGNGYTDDISGWDFLKNDNDPYDDTRYGHGTGEARDSTAAGNNGMGDIGVCPLCRFVPLRVGDSFIADAQDFAKAVVYAADNGALVVQEALGTINMSGFAQTAMDYAWAKGVVIVASMADENSRHHNMPAAANHTMPVHAITMLGSGEQSTTAESFLAFNTCTNYGAQNYLSASGTGCSSEATGRTSGIAGLLHSMALEAGTGPLSPGELQQVLFATADDIDIPESREAGSRHFWSQPGFDQRFGYGRINVNTAVEWVKDGRIPPDVDVVRPFWFETLYEDQVNGPVAIKGSIKTRAPSFDYVAEWAPGVQPLDSDFKRFGGMDNVSGPEFPTDGSALAELDIRGLDLTHERDVDSPLGENDRTITVRIRATAHYGGSLGDVHGELRRAYQIHTDPDLLPGFPIHLGASGESSPKAADLNGDGVRDLVLATADGKINAWDLSGSAPTLLPGFPIAVKPLDGLDGDASRPDYRAAPAYANASSGVNLDAARESIVATPALGDLDGDGKLEIVVATWSGTVFAFHADGSSVSGWPVRMPDIPSCPLDGSTPAGPCMDTVTRIARGAFGSPVLEDMDKDGKLDVVQAGFDGKIYIFKPDGTALPGWPVALHDERSAEYNRVFTTPAVADFTGDGIPDVLTGSNERIGNGSNAGNFYLIDGRGTTIGEKPWLTNWPVTMTSFNLFPVIAEGTTNSPVAADFDGDGKPEGVMHGNVSAPLIVPSDPGVQANLADTPTNALPIRDEDGTTKRGLAPTSIFGANSNAVAPDTMFPLFAQPSLGDLNQDGTPDIVSSGGSLSLAQTLLSPQPNGAKAQQLLSMWDGKTGKMLPASPLIIEDFTFFNSQAIADLTGDGYPEVITGSAGYFLHAWDACGRSPEGWPKFTGQWIMTTPLVADLTGDGNLEVTASTRDGWLYVWKTPGRSDGVVQWESFHHDNRNTGNLNVELEQGKMLGASEPLPVDAEGKCIIEGDMPDAGTDGGNQGTGGGGNVDPGGGGCGCSVPGEDSAPSAPWLLALAAPLVWLRRRRRG